MRISGGIARGRALDVPPGTRPTTDRVRQAIFNVLAANGPLSGRALDLYAGSGALGIEALSRGFDHCDFVEERLAACESIRENLRRTGLAGRATVVPLRVQRALDRLEGPYDLVLADPPYADDSALAPVDALADRLLPDAVIVLEHSGRLNAPEAVAGLPAHGAKRYGDSAVTFYSKEG